eukprot:4453525-Pyramimonas_sp.AAC.1
MARPPHRLSEDANANELRTAKGQSRTCLAPKESMSTMSKRSLSIAAAASSRRTSHCVMRHDPRAPLRLPTARFVTIARRGASLRER